WMRNGAHKRGPTANSVAALTDLHYPKSFIKRPNDLRHLSLKSCQQRLLPAVADSNPKQFSGVAWPVGEMKKILVLAHHDPVGGSGVIPDFEVGCFVHVQAEDMAGL